MTFSSDAVLLHGLTEERSEIPASWLDVGCPELVRLIETDSVTECGTSGPDAVVIQLRRRNDIESFLAKFTGRPIYLDVTGLSHHVWMPLLRTLVETAANTNVVYAEPGSYKISTNPRPSEFFDLSERIRGVLPIPTFAKVARRGARDPATVALLGFEGARFKYLLETLQPEGDRVYPIVGVPGFQVEYPFHTYEGNADPLETSHSWQNATFVDASCPFSLFTELKRLQEWNGEPLRIAPIGTKPHAIGAALYAILNESAELVYDHPIRKKGRTSGAGRYHVYRVSEFIATT